MSKFGSAVGRTLRPVTDALTTAKNFVVRHWVTALLLSLGLLAAVGLGIAIAFTGPAIPTGLAAIFGALPWFGGTAASAWLTGLIAANLPAAAAFTAAVAFGAYTVGYAAVVTVGQLFNLAYTKFDNWMTKNLPENQMVEEFVKVAEGENGLELYKKLGVKLEVKKGAIEPRYFDLHTHKPLTQREALKISGIAVNEDSDEDSDHSIGMGN